MTSATDELRRMLDERGVEWRGGLPTETMVEADGLDLLYVALPDGRVRAFIRNYLTPEQAIEATLGGDLKAENDKLREEIHWLKQGDILHVLTDQEYIDQCEREHLMQVSIDALDKENAKLRELIADLWEYIHIGTAQDGQSLHDRMHELGVDA